ncbi:MAG: hypothetical protein AB1714_16630 [Acidobacteriota bacterium]
MYSRHSELVGIVVVTAMFALVVPAVAQEANAPEGPTRKAPLRFTAIAVSMPQGVEGQVQIVVERWTTDDERQALVTALAQGGQDKLLSSLQSIKERTGFIRTPNSIGYDLRYCRENMLADGTRQIVIATDKPVSFLAAASQARTMDYPFTIVELRFDKDDKGEGKMLVGTRIAVANGRLELENYGQQPVRLSNVRESK